LNVSREGVFLALDMPSEPFTLLAMQAILRSGQMPLQVVGESRWRRVERDRDLHQVGLAFVGLAPQVSERWAGEVYAAH
jgi:hypothetical protein